MRKCQLVFMFNTSVRCRPWVDLLDLVELLSPEQYSLDSIQHFYPDSITHESE